MADPVPKRDQLGGLSDRLRSIENRLDILSNPTGTQRATAVAELHAQIEKVQELGEGLDERVDDAMQASTAVVRNGGAGLNQLELKWVSPRIQMRVDGTYQGEIAQAGEITGRVAKTGDTMSGDLYLPGSSLASSGYTVAYINGDGRVSRGASSERYKNRIHTIDPTTLGEIFPDLYEFVMRADPGQMARVGWIAERLNENPDLRRFVVYERAAILDDDGNVIGHRLVRDSNGDPKPESIDFVALLTAQTAALHARELEHQVQIAALTKRLDALEALG